MTAAPPHCREETTDVFRVTRTAAPSVYFHLPVFTAKDRGVSRALQSSFNHTVITASQGGRTRSRAGGRVGDSGPKWGPHSCRGFNSSHLFLGLPA